MSHHTSLEMSVTESNEMRVQYADVPKLLHLQRKNLSDKMADAILKLDLSGDLSDIANIQAYIESCWFYINRNPSNKRVMLTLDKGLYKGVTDKLDDSEREGVEYKAVRDRLD